MERLTEKDQYSHDYKIQSKNLDSHCVAKDKRGYVTYYGQHIDKLAEYEDLEEQGLLLRLQVKAGDTVYALRYGEENDFIVVETKIIEIRQNFNGIFFEPLISRKAYKTEDFGKEVFLTREEAEQKLKEMESD